MWKWKIWGCLACHFILKKKAKKGHLFTTKRLFTHRSQDLLAHTKLTFVRDVSIAIMTKHGPSVEWAVVFRKVKPALRVMGINPPQPNPNYVTAAVHQFWSKVNCGWHFCFGFGKVFPHH